MQCRFCNNSLEHIFVDLNNSPPSNSYLTKKQLNEAEVYYPLKVFICDKCWLIQIDEYKKSKDIFDNEYAYFSSMSKLWLEHSKKYVDMIAKKLSLSKSSQVVEIASNDGYLLQYFKEKQIPCLGVEPCSNTALISKEKGIETIEEFFTFYFAENFITDRDKVDLVLGNNVYAHVPNINDFTRGLKIILKDSGTITLEFPHLLNLIKYNQFDTIYHEHFSYLSLITVKRIFNKFDLEVYDVEKIKTHGGSLRIYGKHLENKNILQSNSVQKLLDEEIKYGLTDINFYIAFKDKVNKIKYDFIDFLIKQKQKGKTVAAYGAAAKGNTFLNYCGIKNDMIDFVVDRACSKQNKYLPGSHIPVVTEESLKITKPDFLILFPWNLKKELVAQLNYIRNWGGKFVISIPKLKVF